MNHQGVGLGDQDEQVEADGEVDCVITLKPWRPRVYISGPITRGDREHNFKQADEAQKRLMLAGFAPLNPMLSMQCSFAWDLPHHLWIECDLPWVEVSDAVLRLPGESVGADQEVSHAIENGIPVFRSIEDLSEAFKSRG